MRSKKRPSHPGGWRWSRREFVETMGLGGAALLAGCDSKSEGTASASPLPGPSGTAEGPEVRDLKFGIIALTDCSPIVIAHEKGFFKKYGINATVAKGANWAAIRDSLANGDNHGTHMLIGMPIASTMGLAGSPKKPMIIPWILNRNGQAITLANRYKGKVQDNAKPLKPC